MAYVSYQQNEDGTYRFLDDAGQYSPSMAGPAALQQAAKLNANQLPPPPPPVDLTPGPKPIRGERAELSPEMLQAGEAGPDMRTAEVKAPNGSIMDAGGAPALSPEQQELAKLIDNGMSADDAKRYQQEHAKMRENFNAAKDWLSGVGQRFSSAVEERKNREREKAGLPPVPVAKPPGAKPDQAFDSEQVVPEGERVQLAQPKQQGLQLAPMASGGGSAPRLQEMKVGEATAFTTVDPQNVANIKRADQNRYEAVEQLGASQAAAGQNVTGVLSEVPQGLTSLEQERQAQEQSIADRVQQDHEELDQLRAESRSELDSGRFWKKKSNGEKFMGALAMGLGAYVQAMGGGPNAAMQIINKAIDDDIMEQKENRAAARERFQDKRLSMADKKQVFQDERQNFLAKKSAYLDVAQSKVAAFMQDAKTEEQKAKAAELMAQIQRESEMTMAEFSKVSHQVQTKVVQTGGSGGGVKMEDLNRGLVVKDLNGRKFLARDEKAAGELNKFRPLTQTAIEAAKEMREIANKPGFEKLDPTDPAVERFNFARERFMNSFNSMQEQGVVRTDDVERYTKDVVKGAYGLSTAKMAETLAQRSAANYSQHFEAKADTETEVEERAELDQKKGIIKKGVHYNQQQLLTGTGPRQQVNFTPAVKK